MTEAIREFVAHINLVQSSTLESKEWVTIGQPWSRIAWSMRRNASLANYMSTSFTNHQNPYILRASWPFDAWGLDVVGPITPKSSFGHIYILAATDYFSKWAEAVPLREVKKETIVDFILINIIFRYGIPRYIITDNGRPFYNKSMDKLCAQFGFKQHNSSMYNAAANGLAEAFNKTLCNILNKVVSKSKRDWHEKIGEALWAYRTTHRTATQATPYSLVYGVEAVLPLKVKYRRFALQYKKDSLLRIMPA
ncbi:UNVERIFIED_CONTAM: hypothetical protein Slati_0734400 [Sesamum latifolium]|uniref:Integrase catalytic domain-containing protein n=1 Tax=Sesamum latifolium TaxID=2727402 RepID=A0AAW2Y5H0_9LAMI